MTANQLEDFVLEEHLEQAPVWEAEERQEMANKAREDLDTLQDFIKNGFYEPKICILGE